MTSFQATDEHLNLIGADSVYMLLHPGWEKEGRANRWHFAKRWATHRNVVIVSPDLPWSGHVTRPETRLPNCRILKVAANQGPLWRPPAMIQTAQILDDMAAFNHSRPLLWLYNANFAEAFAALPAVARVHHVTENFFDYPAISPSYLERVKAVTRLSDLNVAVSEGCAAPLRSYTNKDRLIVVTNGCDFTEYDREGFADEQVSALRGDFDRLAIFAGNINDRLDFDLIADLAEKCPDTLLLFVGPVAHDSRIQSRFGALLRCPNVKSLGAVNPDRLPAIYRSADLGFIPYTQAPLLVDNGFPLKALEMAAAGLPVVSSFMRPLAPLSPPLTVTRDSSAFVAAFAQARRTTETSIELRSIAAANDYDTKFSAIVSDLAELDRIIGPLETGVASTLPITSPEDLRKALHSYRRSLRGHVDSFYYRSFALMQKLLAMLPAPTVHRLRKIKWIIRGEIRRG
jgi:glycosyltransferase involved in cell wall biosynthesis